MEPKLKYAMHYYRSPSYGTWHEWFAWYPVKMVTFEKDTAHGTVFHGATWDDYFIRYYRWVWLKKIARRRVTDYLDGPGREGAGHKKYYEYTTLMDLLRHGH